MSPDRLRNVTALIRAARLAPRPDRYTTVLAYTAGLLTGGVTDPETVGAQLEAVGVHDRVWRDAVWATSPPVEVVSRRGVRADFLARHGAPALPRCR